MSNLVGDDNSSPLPLPLLWGQCSILSFYRRGEIIVLTSMNLESRFNDLYLDLVMGSNTEDTYMI